jgi:hypothetical protein
MNHYDDIAADYLPALWSLSGDFAVCACRKVESLKRKWFGASCARFVLDLLISRRCGG